MRKRILILVVMIAAASLAGSAKAEPKFMFFYDANDSTMFNGAPVPVGSIITAYDADSMQIGIDTVEAAGTFGSMTVNGDTDETPEDDGAEEGETVSFRINGLDATVTAGDPTFNDKALKSISLSVTTATVGLNPVDLPGDAAGQPGATFTFRVGVENTGNILDFYYVRVDSMKIPEDSGDPFGWKAFVSADPVYNMPDSVAYPEFDIKVATFSVDTVNTVYYTVWSGVDSTQQFSDEVNVILSITDVDDGFDGLVPDGFALQQNYPNPFNPATTIAFSLPARTNVRFTVYDMLGRVVERRDLGALPAGEHSIDFDGSSLASGVYLYRLTTETAAQTRKMILVK